ncbi:MAG: 50S ribosomal protein L5 [bacterium]|nr:50S ribosomal protein L5 [bacterium]
MRFKERYQKEVIPKMMEKFGYQNKMAVPRIEKAVVNTGFGKQVAGLSGEENKKFCQAVLDDLASICGQKGVLTFSKKSIASFKLREGVAIGAKVTLRGEKLADFIDRLIRVALPRSRDFRGIDPKSLDKEGNLSLGLKEQIIFPEVSPESAKKIFGLEIAIATTAKTREESLELLRLLGFPIKS